MKKLIVAILALLLLSLCACGSDDPTPNTSEPVATTQPSDATPETAAPSTEPIQEPTAPSENPTQPSEKPTEPSDSPHTHAYTETVTKIATCSAAGEKTFACACGHSYATSIEKLAHDYANATCTAPKTCKTCKATEGETAGHSWSNATCTTPKTCKVCKATDGEALGHNWKAATTSTPKTCTSCGTTEGECLPVNWEFTDGGDHIVANDGIKNIIIPIDTSHLPKSEKTEDMTVEITVYRENFCYVNGWVVYYERYFEKSSSGLSGGSSTIPVGYFAIKMDGTGQKKLNDISPDTIAGSADGYMYYIRTEGWEVCGETEYQWLCKVSFSDDGQLGKEVIVTDELEGISNEWFDRAWMEDGWVYYCCTYDGEDDMVAKIYKIKPDGTQNQYVGVKHIPY